MKKFWIVLLALGLVAGFAMSASAADVKFSGSYYVYGIYVDNPAMVKDGKVPQAYYHQRLRVQTEFKVAEGLALVTRFDALEKPWGYGQVGTADSWRASNAYDVTNRDQRGRDRRTEPRRTLNSSTPISISRRRSAASISAIRISSLGARCFSIPSDQAPPGIKYFVPIGPVTRHGGY